MKKLNAHELLGYITRAGIIAALYAALTMFLAPISFGALQFRVSEALTVLPFFMPEAVFGLLVGCIISNILSPNIVLLDVIFGSLATFLAALVTSRIKIKWLAPLPPVIFNALIVSAVIAFSMEGAGSGFFAVYMANILSVGFGELVVCYGLGLPLLLLCQKTKIFSRRQISEM